MKKFEIENILKITVIKNELEFEHALSIQNRLRWMIKEDESLFPIRDHLRNLIADYEKNNWLNKDISSQQIEESDNAVQKVEQETIFIFNRKEHIKKALKDRDLTQEDLGQILGHRKNYISELINGVRPFSNKDLIILHKLLKIELQILIPTFINKETAEELRGRIINLNKPKLELELA